MWTNALFCTFSATDDESIVLGINKLFNNKEIVKKISGQAIRDIKNKYTWSHRVAKIEDFINNTFYVRNMLIRAH